MKLKCIWKHHLNEKWKITCSLNENFIVLGIETTWKFWLLWLNPKTGGEHLTCELSWVAAWLLVTRLYLLYLVKEHCHIGEIYLPLGRKWAGKCRRVVGWEGGKGISVEWGSNVGKVGEWWGGTVREVS